jgi:hypothetical protein
MQLESKTVTLRKLTADEGMVITDKETQTLRAREIYLGKGERRDNFIEIEEDTPSDEEVKYD